MNYERWGRCPWFPESGMGLVHPDDRETFRREAHNCKVFACVAEGDYYTVWYHQYYRVKPELFRPVPKPKFEFGQKVTWAGAEKAAVVTDILWHLSKQEHYYFLSIGGKKKTRRFYESELSDASAT